MPKVVINDRQGLVQQSGSGVEINSSVTFSASPNTSVNALTADTTLQTGGVYTVSSTGALTLTMPLASAVPGATFVVRSLSAHAHALTGSQEANGTLVFAGMPGATPANQGSKLSLPAVVGSSVALISDGNSFLVMAASGSAAISGT